MGCIANSARYANFVIFDPAGESRDSGRDHNRRLLAAGWFGRLEKIGGSDCQTHDIQPESGSFQSRDLRWHRSGHIQIIPRNAQIPNASWIAPQPCSLVHCDFKGKSGIRLRWNQHRIATVLGRGTTWSVVSAWGLPARTTMEALAISPVDKEHLLAATSVGLFESRNGGIHWRRVEDNRMGGAVGSVLFLDDSGKRILAANKSTGGIFYSEDSGQNWDMPFLPQFKAVVYCLVRDPQRSSRIYAGTQSDGVYSLDFP